MIKVKTLKAAIRISDKTPMSIGFCVLDGYYYVGLEKELKKIAPIIIRKGS